MDVDSLNHLPKLLPSSWDLSLPECLDDLEKQDLPVFGGSSWMALHGSKSLLSLIMPGTHNSAAYDICFSQSCPPVPSMVSLKVAQRLTITQELTIWEQLMTGVRVFDFRIARRGQTFWVVHMFSLIPLNFAVAQLLLFVRRFPSERIVIHAKPGWEQRRNITNQEVCSRLKELLHPFLMDKRDAATPMCEGENKSGKRILLFCDLEEEDPLIFCGHWANTNKVDELRKKTATELWRPRAEFDRVNVFR